MVVGRFIKQLKVIKSLQVIFCSYKFEPRNIPINPQQVQLNTLKCRLRAHKFGSTTSTAGQLDKALESRKIA